MSELELHIQYEQETGRHAPELSIDDLAVDIEEVMDYITWLQNKLIAHYEKKKQ